MKVIILGGTSGIGLGTARLAAAAGAQVTVVSGNPAKVEAALRELPQGTEGYALDLSRESNVAEFFRSAGEFDHLVYTAADSLTLQPLRDTDLSGARKFLELRYWGALTAVKYAAPRLRPGGSIGLMGGIAGARPRAGWALAASVCMAMEGLTRALAVELAPLRVNCVSAGVIRTPLWSSIPEESREAFYTATAAQLPVGRIGEPDDIGRAFVYLMGQTFATGQVLVVDGGAVLV
ncbi:MAG TPA: SDR family oxidoreductase [Dinghuibacter sp.]|jgi:NAD(P)-dependent dehydrogenase (short-subunit alcohol dehydrogenase family)|uniref:SDR family oxidoreductase n=1 Tax=Dinghuibacter sp. TaxID=2024697 RepID=UPI002C7C73EF|nr:SDR family oxidoreductase [Dinghuibacter sp.]HTJ14104.1 SDR family oxidoreductase [Dinghuibacter sp.]